MPGNEFKSLTANLSDQPPSKKKRRTSSSVISSSVAPCVQDLLPPPLTGHGDTIVASNPFDDTPVKLPSISTTTHLKNATRNPINNSNYSNILINNNSYANDPIVNFNSPSGRNIGCSMRFGMCSPIDGNTNMNCIPPHNIHENQASECAPLSNISNVRNCRLTNTHSMAHLSNNSNNIQQITSSTTVNVSANHTASDCNYDVNSYNLQKHNSSLLLNCDRNSNINCTSDGPVMNDLLGICNINDTNNLNSYISRRTSGTRCSLNNTDISYSNTSRSLPCNTIFNNRLPDNTPLNMNLECIKTHSEEISNNNSSICVEQSNSLETNMINRISGTSPRSGHCFNSVAINENETNIHCEWDVTLKPTMTQRYNMKPGFSYLTPNEHDLQCNSEVNISEGTNNVKYPYNMKGTTNILPHSSRTESQLNKNMFVMKECNLNTSILTTNNSCDVNKVGLNTAYSNKFSSKMYNSPCDIFNSDSSTGSSQEMHNSPESLDICDKKYNNVNKDVNNEFDYRKVTSDFKEYCVSANNQINHNTLDNNNIHYNIGNYSSNNSTDIVSVTSATALAVANISVTIIPSTTVTVSTTVTSTLTTATAVTGSDFNCNTIVSDDHANTTNIITTSAVHITSPITTSGVADLIKNNTITVNTVSVTDTPNINSNTDSNTTIASDVLTTSAINISTINTSTRITLTENMSNSVNTYMNTTLPSMSLDMITMNAVTESSVKKSNNINSDSHSTDHNLIIHDSNINSNSDENYIYNKNNNYNKDSTDDFNYDITPQSDTKNGVSVVSDNIQLKDYSDQKTSDVVISTGNNNSIFTLKINNTSINDSKNADDKSFVNVNINGMPKSTLNSITDYSEDANIYENVISNSYCNDDFNCDHSSSQLKNNNDDNSNNINSNLTAIKNSTNTHVSIDKLDDTGVKIHNVDTFSNQIYVKSGNFSENQESIKRIDCTTKTAGKCNTTVSLANVLNSVSRTCAVTTITTCSSNSDNVSVTTTVTRAVETPIIATTSVDAVISVTNSALSYSDVNVTDTTNTYTDIVTSASDTAIPDIVTITNTSNTSSSTALNTTTTVSAYSNICDSNVVNVTATDSTISTPSVINPSSASTEINPVNFDSNTTATNIVTVPISHSPTATTATITTTMNITTTTTACASTAINVNNGSVTFSHSNVYTSTYTANVSAITVSDDSNSDKNDFSDYIDGYKINNSGIHQPDNTCIINQQTLRAHDNDLVNNNYNIGNCNEKNNNKKCVAESTDKIENGQNHLNELAIAANNCKFSADSVCNDKIYSDIENNEFNPDFTNFTLDQTENDQKVSCKSLKLLQSTNNMTNTRDCCVISNGNTFLDSHSLSFINNIEKKDQFNKDIKEKSTFDTNVMTGEDYSVYNSSINNVCINNISTIISDGSNDNNINGLKPGESSESNKIQVNDNNTISKNYISGSNINLLSSQNSCFSDASMIHANNLNTNLDSTLKNDVHMSKIESTNCLNNRLFSKQLFQESRTSYVNSNATLGRIKEDSHEYTDNECNNDSKGNNNDNSASHKTVTDNDSSGNINCSMKNDGNQSNFINSCNHFEASTSINNGKPIVNGNNVHSSTRLAIYSNDRCLNNVYASHGTPYNSIGEICNQPNHPCNRENNVQLLSTAGCKVYPTDKSKVFNIQNPNAPPIYPCGVCHKEVQDNDQAILCESGCNFWFHRICSGLTEAAYQLLTAEIYAEWVCDKCLNTKNIPLIKFKP